MHPGQLSAYDIELFHDMLKTYCEVVNNQAELPTSALAWPFGLLAAVWLLATRFFGPNRLISSQILGRFRVDSGLLEPL